MEALKYLEALQYESADTVMGSIMSAADFPALAGIEDACDVQHSTTNQHDLQQIARYQPMFYNVAEHRLVNQADVLRLLDLVTQKQ
ncbi:unnamed protein product [Fructobacillus tropaeoli]|uniref:Uncharacterized protein n=1 Tax=Fructobacillus tropaeoli TaxID=709323 RepID=A0ABM9MMP5_9LACO|nr:unnamed protein product [Fructobacillus tropaeoli]CAK1227217.1 unnamed protein product [Fructobacillus tropaeoli]CAK1236221.1 unnamed protein product [Fructobacillus tropaeoli]